MENGWYFGLDNQVVGPVDLQQLLDFLRSSEQWRRVLVWHEGFEEWKPVKDIPEIADQMTAKGPPPLPAPPVELPPAPAPVAIEAPPQAPAVEPPPPSPVVTPPPPPTAAVTPPQAAEPPAPTPAPVVNVAPVASIVPDATPAQPTPPPVEAPKPVEAVAPPVVAAAPVVAAPVAAAPVVAAPIATVAPPVVPAAAEALVKKRRRGWTAVLMVIALSAAGVLGHYTGRRDILSSFTKAPDIAAPPAQAKGSPANDAEIERGFASVLQATTASLPKKIDDWTVMYDVTASGRRMVYHHTLDTTKYLVPPNFAATMKQKMLAEACNGAMGEALKAGGSVEYRYHTQALFFVGNFDIAGGDCGAQTAVK